MGAEGNSRARKGEQFRGKLVRKLVVYGALSVAMMGIIFAFSAMDGGASTSQSDGIAFWLAGHFIEGFGAMGYPDQLAAIRSMTYPIRKAAHVTEYAVLGGLFVATFWQLVQLRGADRGALPKRAFWRAWALGLACAVLYACTDEFHQTFTSGRTGQPVDVLIDSIGILIGTLAVIAFVCRRASAKERLP